MKILRLVNVVLLVVTIGIVSCDKGSDKSSACDILSFKVDDTSWQITEGNIICYFGKTDAQTPLTPTITVSDKATISPGSGVAQDFFSGGVTYTVTAEDGTKKQYVAKAIVQ
jgi:hypothetical protein